MQHDLLQIIGNEAVLHGYIDKQSLLVLLLLVVASIAVLAKGADWLIEGAVDLAVRTGMPKIVIGATIISLGTTLPEMFVSVMAAFMGNPGLALGNGVGSIIADTGLIFGLSCVLAAMPVNRYILNRTGWIQVGAAVLLVAISVIALATRAPDSSPMLERWVGFFFLALLAAYLYITYYWSKQKHGEEKNSAENEALEARGLTLSWILLLGGLVLVIVGARLLVPGASEIAERIGVPDDVIAASMVAFGTSLPELITAITAIRKGHPEITVGNVVGADVLNCLFVIGAAAAAVPLAIPQNFYTLHFPVMLLILFSFRGFISTNKSGYFSKWQGIWLLSIYVGYLVIQYS
ncbi:MAG: calcium/sodium antiporter [Desulfofustis sp.]|nr:calcium/sodium antiporter [Desulfofustis sp.]NNK58292.1 calcium/sodium antiporter [Desulfofustis sp.]